MNNPAWNLLPGAKIARTDLHDQYGGLRQGGISPSTTSPNIFLFADPEVGPKHGYVDGWKDDGLFDYTGSGPIGDQEANRGVNKSVLQHAETAKTLRLFRGSAGKVEYVGEFALVESGRADAPETGGGPTRSVVVFRLKPLDGNQLVQKATSPAPASYNEVAEVPIEEQNSERHAINPAKEPSEAERREAALVIAFAAFLKRQGYTAIRQRIRPRGAAKPLYTDLFCAQLNLLVEAKGSIERGSIRMALGQLADYRRFLVKPRCAILVPFKLSDDLLDLAKREGVLVFWPDGADYVGVSSLTATA